ELDRLACLVQCAKQRRRGLANLKVYRTVLDLNDDVVIELAVEFVKVVVGGSSAIILRIFPVHVVVVHEAAIEDHAAVRLERASEHIRCARVRAALCGWSDAAFRSGPGNEAGKIATEATDFVGLPLPPCNNG